MLSRAQPVTVPTKPVPILANDGVGQRMPALAHRSGFPVFSLMAAPAQDFQVFDAVVVPVVIAMMHDQPPAWSSTARTGALIVGEGQRTIVFGASTASPEMMCGSELSALHGQS
jgi:hypothetical protein